MTPVLLGYHYVHPRNGRPMKRPDNNYGNTNFVNNEAALIQGQWALITSDYGACKFSSIENARLAILRRVPRTTHNLITHTDFEEFPMSIKPQEARCGVGVPAIKHFAYKFATGVPLFELTITPGNQVKLTKLEAEAIFFPGRLILPMDTIVVPQGRVDEYNCFK